MEEKIITYDDGGALQTTTRTQQRPSREEVLVKIHAAGVNRADLLQRRGRYPAPPGAPSDVLGLEFAGEVIDLGEGAAQAWSIGDAVMGICEGGGYGQSICRHHRALIPIPEGLNFEEAAAMPEAWLTGYDALFQQGNLRGGERVLIHAVGSGVGTATAQLAVAAGAEVYGSSRQRWKLERASELGVRCLLAESGQFLPALHAAGQRGVDLIIDFIGAAYLEENLRALSKQGRLVCLGLLGGMKGSIELGRLLQRRLTVRGAVLRPRPLEEKLALTQRFIHEVNPRLSSAGPLRPILSETFPLTIDGIDAAHERLRSDASWGKLVLTRRESALPA